MAATIEQKIFEVNVMAYLKDYDSTVCVSYIYERLHDALDSNDLECEISR